MENQIKRRKPSEYWGALTNDGVIYLMECGLTKGAYVTFLFMCQYIGDDGIYHGTINELYQRMKQEFEENVYMQTNNISKLKPHYLSKQTIYNSVQELENNRIIYKLNNAFEYLINPEIYYKGGKREKVPLMRKWLKIEKIDPDDINIDVRTELKNKGFPIIESMLAGIYNV